MADHTAKTNKSGFLRHSVYTEIRSRVLHWVALYLHNTAQIRINIFLPETIQPRRDGSVYVTTPCPL